MSKFSGKCDLYDHIASSYEDEMEAFEHFKKATNGIIYQHIPIKLTKHNINMMLEKDKYLERVGSAYSWYGTIYKSLKSIPYTYTNEIHIETLLDLIPYYPYIIGILAYDKGNDTMHIEIGSQSYVDKHATELLECGIESNMSEHYKRKLQKHYVEVVNKYYGNQKEERKFV